MDIQNAPAALTILLITVGISLYAMLGNRELYYRMLLHPWSVVHENKWYQVITSGFIHADFGHLLFNMLSFYFFAFQLEGIIGPVRFLIIYFVSMILSDVSTIIKRRNDYNYYSVGASGAISGVLFSSILFQPTAKIGLLFFPMGLPAPIFGILYLVYCYFAARRSGSGINHEAHFWGALVGIIVTIIMIPEIVPYFIEQVF